VSTDWSALYEATYPDLVRFLYRLVWDEERAQDLAQDAFVRALRHEPDNPRAWLFAVARNLARDEARTALRRRRHLSLIQAETVESEADIEPELERSERHEAVRQALRGMSERDREILLLWDAGLSYDDISSETGLARGAVGTTLSRARRRLVEAHEAWEERDAAHR
jgi:RNA polymerase sigma-70 factor (ECF subfamily)